ncbi:hypothetical protein BU17DRAFT_89094 [Hysterangium stoloniferum]|nr:hypothetical protein BU17DRAFT_89094 [Hysterangium stoloniferum]
MALARAASIICAQSFDWLNNDQGDNPCTVASSILKQCDPNQTFTLSPIKSGQTYLSPSAQQADTYLCNTVIYSLVSACATCQDGTFQTYPQWSSNCPADKIQQSGRFPNQTVLLTPLPSYASFPLTLNGSWDRMSASGISSLLSMSQTEPMQPNSRPWNIVITVVVVTILVICITTLGGTYFYCQRHRSTLPVYHPIGSHRPLSNADGSDESHTAVEESIHLAGPPSRWIPLNITIPLFRYLRPSSVGRVSPYNRGPRQTTSPEDTPPRKPPPQLNSHAHPAAPPSSPPSAYLRPANSSMSQLSATGRGPQSQSPHSTAVRGPRPKPPQRINTFPQPIDTFPLIQSITRVRANSTPNVGRVVSTEVTSRPVDPVVNVARPQNFRIEDTPTTTDGFPGLHKRPGPPSKRDQLVDPIIGASVASLASSTLSRYERQCSTDESDSLLPPPRFQSRPARSAPSLRAPSTRGSVSDASAVSFNDDFLSSESMAGSSIAPRSPWSPAVPSSKGQGLDDVFGYEDNQSRTRLFPAAVRAAGYIGVPHKTER